MPSAVSHDQCVVDDKSLDSVANTTQMMNKVVVSWVTVVPEVSCLVRIVMPIFVGFKPRNDEADVQMSKTFQDVKEVLELNSIRTLVLWGDRKK